MSREEEDKRAKERSRRPRRSSDQRRSRDSRSSKASSSDGGDRDREAKARARRDRSRDQGEVKPGAVRSSSNDHSESRESRKARRHGSGSPSRSSARRSSGTRESDREAKQRARAGRSSGSAVTPGASRSTDNNGSDRDARRMAKMGSSRARATGSRSSDRDEKLKAKLRSGDNINKEEEHTIQVDKAGPNGEVQLEAVAVGDDLENQELKNKNAEIERLRQQMETMANQQHTTEEQSDENDKEDTSSSSKWKIICVILVVLAIAGGVAGYIFGTQESPSPQVQESPTPAPTEGVTITASTPAPTILSSSNPTDMILYPAPNEDDCKAIASESTVQGQDDLYTSEYVLDIDATLAFGMDEESWRSLLNDSLQSKLLPAAAGCSLPIVRRLSSASSDRDLQQSSSLPNFVIANGKIIESTVVAGGCKDDPSDDCFRVNVTFALWLRDPSTKLLYVVAHLVETLGDSPVDFLDLGTLLSDLVIVSGRSISPTDQPSWSPSSNPTMDQPSLSPTESASSRPSFSPIVGPTTSRPTQVPTEAPIVSPTAPPTVAPVVAPVAPITTENPTASPTTAPVVVPTLAPVVGPSPPPTQLPSESPSDSPSSGPSLSPSSLPSIRPSSAPSGSPSGSPSGRPSNRPSLIESDPPTITEIVQPLWEFEISLQNPNIACTGGCETTGETVTIDMYSNDGLVKSSSFAGVGLPGTSISENAPDVSKVTISINGGDAMFIDYAVLSKDGATVKQWGTDDSLNGYCLSTDAGEQDNLSNGSGSSTVLCHPSHDFEVVEPLWEFEISLQNPNIACTGGCETTGETVTIDMYSDYGLVKSSSFAGVGFPGTSISENAPDVSKVTVSINGGDAMFIDYAVLSKDGATVKQWGTDDGLDGYCLSTDAGEQDTLSNGSGSSTVLCHPSHDFEVI